MIFSSIRKCFVSEDVKGVWLILKIETFGCAPNLGKIQYFNGAL
jgi:hypothetical protein